ncbi:MAG: hypothetical protein M3Y56_10225 [Armatimonadota bacterium]|nr:hypothetical protein [Armatimonadota bacterium]
MGRLLPVADPVHSPGGDIPITEMFGHGIITGGLFLVVGMLSEQAGLRDLRQLTGAMKRAPVFVVIFSIFMFGSMAMPGLMGFWGELYILLGAYPKIRLGAALSALGIAFTAGFFIWALQRMAFGETTPATETLTDIKANDIWSIAPLLFLMFFFGFFPAFYLTPWVGALNQLGMYLVRH